MEAPKILWFEPQDGEQPSRHYFHNSRGRLTKYVRADTITPNADVLKYLEDIFELDIYEAMLAGYDEAAATVQDAQKWLESLSEDRNDESAQ